jgi:hypothetical protein
MIIAAERRKSDFSPTRAAMMKSAGEQSAGHASLQGFSSQYSHRFSSACNWALVREPSFVFIAPVLINHFILTSQEHPTHTLIALCFTFFGSDGLVAVPQPDSLFQPPFGCSQNGSAFPTGKSPAALRLCD